jgi:FkbM family methyltransferase
LLRPGAVVIDIGANIGSHTLPLAKLVGSGGHVYAAEPTLYAFAKLKKNLKRNADLAKRVTAMHCYLLAKAGSVVPDTAYSSWPLNGGRGLHALHGGRPMPIGNAVALTLDEFVTKMGLSRIDLIKLDVDGAEAEVLAGARETIAHFHPPLLVEFAPQDDVERDSFSEMVHFLTSMNYDYYDVQHRRVLPHDLKALKNEILVGSSVNVLCLPKRAGFSAGRALRAHRQDRNIEQ